MTEPPACQSSSRYEWQTWAVIVAIYGGFATLTWHHAALPWWLVAVLGAYLVAWHGSLQHEAVHGHPTRLPWLNTLLAGLPLTFWLPYPLYRAWHAAHHRAGTLACPLDDPESFYVTAAVWAEAGKTARALLRIHNTLAGRLLIGPVFLVATFLGREVKRFVVGDFSHLGVWLGQFLGGVIVISWLVYCAMPIWFYLVCIVWPAISLTLLRSYHEHRPAEDAADRTATVIASPPMALLYLNNNLHAAHHHRPDLAWYVLPRLQGAMSDDDGYLVPGYGALFRRYLFTPKDDPVYPY